MYFNPDETYKNAIENNEKGVLKALLIGIISGDPTFATTEFEEARKYIREQSILKYGKEINLEEPYIFQEDEYYKDSDEWDSSYLHMQLVWLRDNFAINERLPKIQEIGKKVYKDKKTMGKWKLQNRTSNTSKNMKATIEHKGKNITDIGTKCNELSDIRLFSRSWWTKRWWLIVAIVALFFICFKFFFYM